MNEIETISSAFEFATLSHMASDVAGSYFALYLSVVSGYLIAAYLAGSKLTNPQIKLVNSFFVVSALYFVWSTFANNIAVLAYQLQIPSAPHAITYFIGAINLFISIIMAVGIFACLRFMRDVRVAKTSSSSDN